MEEQQPMQSYCQGIFDFLDFRKSSSQVEQFVFAREMFESWFSFIYYLSGFQVRLKEITGKSNIDRFMHD